MNDTKVMYPDLGLTVFEAVVSSQLIQRINTTIDVTRAQWRPADGRREVVAAASFADWLRQSAAFRAVEAYGRSTTGAWAEATLGRRLPERVLNVLRCVNRETSQQAHLRHFDSHALTLLIPLQGAETGERNGDLLLYKKQRTSLSLLHNISDKACLLFQQNLPLPMRRALTHHDLRRECCARVACRPGNVYMFNGFTTLHANLEVAVGERRSLVMHFYDAGLTAGLGHPLRLLRELRDRIADEL